MNHASFPCVADLAHWPGHTVVVLVPRLLFLTWHGYDLIYTLPAMAQSDYALVDNVEGWWLVSYAVTIAFLDIQMLSNVLYTYIRANRSITKDQLFRVMVVKLSGDET